MLLVALVSPAARRAALRAPPYSGSSIVLGTTSSIDVAA